MDIPPTPSAPRLPLTGERTAPGHPDENYWFQRHVAAYDHVAARVSGTVLDAGCGEGYGLRILHDADTRGVIGVDVDPATADHARTRYAHDGIDEVDVVEADLDDLPLVDDTLDAVLCLQVIEHLEEPARALAELVRVARPGGLLVLSTPNRLTFSPGDGPPRNPFHVREYTADQLAEMLAMAGANVVEVLGLHHCPDLADRLGPWTGEDPTGVLADATNWSDELRTLVRAIRPDDFVVEPDEVRDLEASLDLVVWARVPS